MILNVEKPYIWLPVSKNAPERKLHFYIEGKKIQDRYSSWKNRL